LLADRYEAPRTELESVLAGIWGDLLGVDRVGIHDNFFALGGDSLLTMKLIHKIHKKLDIKMSLKAIFQFPTIVQLIIATKSIDSDESQKDRKKNTTILELE
ncbi:MAG: phosphopantetheine-binding protein, partial [Allomuricauda sp.]